MEQQQGNKNLVEKSSCMDIVSDKQMKKKKKIKEDKADSSTNCN